MADLHARPPSRGRSQIMPPSSLLTASLSDSVKVRPTVSRSMGGTHTPLFQMVTNAVTYPECGFSVVDMDNQGVMYNKSLVTDGSGPGGRNYVLVEFIPTGTLIFDEAWGWALDHNDWFALDSCVQGDTRYYRYRLKYFSPFDWDPTTGGSPGDKFVDFAALGDNNFPGTRSVHQHWGNRADGEIDIEIYKGGGGGPGVRINDLSLDVWHNIQFKLKSGTTSSSTDGELHIYLDADNNSESTPTVSLAPIGETWNTEGWPGGADLDSYLVVGSTTNSIGIGKSRTFGFTDFQYDNQFDTNWNNP